MGITRNESLRAAFAIKAPKTFRAEVLDRPETVSRLRHQNLMLETLRGALDWDDEENAPDGGREVAAV